MRSGVRRSPTKPNPFRVSLFLFSTTTSSPNGSPTAHNARAAKDAVLTVIALQEAADKLRKEELNLVVELAKLARSDFGEALAIQAKIAEMRPRREAAEKSLENHLRTMRIGERERYDRLKKDKFLLLAMKLR